LFGEEIWDPPALRFGESPDPHFKNHFNTLAKIQAGR
jgi:hypothetical protein